MLAAAVSGFLLGLSLIVAIGAQNAYVLRQGLVRVHVLPVVVICAVSDATLIAAGVAGLGSFIRANPALLSWVAYGGAAFLFVYGALAFRRMLGASALRAGEAADTSLAAAVATCLALTWGNPHVYLDTVVLLGSLSAQYDGSGRLAYGAGAALGSVIWFFALGYGARFLAPLFAKPLAWRILDGLICLVMWAIALQLLIAYP